MMMVTFDSRSHLWPMAFECFPPQMPLYRKLDLVFLMLMSCPWILVSTEEGLRDREVADWTQPKVEEPRVVVLDENEESKESAPLLLSAPVAPEQENEQEVARKVSVKVDQVVQD
ncbi:MAG: hypothetical protein JSS30_05755 [Verrucomicrobia bacterium]|nr:hypothetical protein [Verrucomicrobiota bacterium]